MRPVSLPVLAAIALGVAAPGNAAEQAAPQRPLLQPPTNEIPSPITDRFAARAMYFRASVSTTARYDDIAGNPGTTFNGEDTIGLQDTLNQGWIDLLFRMTPRHRIAAQFYQLRRTGRAVLSQPLEFGDDTFQGSDGEIHSHMELRQLNLGYAYSLVQREKLELGLGVGIHLLQLEGTLEAPATFKREQLDTAGPYPTLAADVTWRFTRRFSVNAATRFVTFNSGGVNGRSLAWNADLQFRAHRNLAVGLGYVSTLYRLDSSDPGYFLGYFKLRYQGPELFLRASF